MYLHNCIHQQAALLYREEDLNDFDVAPRSTVFYQIHGMIDRWYANWEAAHGMRSSQRGSSRSRPSARAVTARGTSRSSKRKGGEQIPLPAPAVEQAASLRYGQLPSHKRIRRPASPRTGRSLRPGQPRISRPLLLSEVQARPEGPAHVAEDVAELTVNERGTPHLSL